MPDRAWSLDAIEAALVGLPRPDFRARLRAALERSAEMTTAAGSARAELGPHVHSGHRPTAAVALRVRDVAKAIDFYTRAFGARELMRFALGDQIPYLDFVIGDSVFVLGGEAPT